LVRTRTQAGRRVAAPRSGARQRPSRARRRVKGAPPPAHLWAAYLVHHQHVWGVVLDALQHDLRLGAAAGHLAARGEGAGRAGRGRGGGIRGGDQGGAGRGRLLSARGEDRGLAALWAFGGCPLSAADRRKRPKPPRRTCSRTARPIAGCGSSPSPASSLEVSWGCGVQGRSVSELPIARQDGPSSDPAPRPRQASAAARSPSALCRCEAAPRRSAAGLREPRHAGLCKQRAPRTARDSPADCRGQSGGLPRTVRRTAQDSPVPCSPQPRH
jgi:hypothetical protein